MSQIIYIEFSKDKFENVVACEKWLRRSQEYDSLLNSKKWKLKTLARSVFISPESRAVFRWFSGTTPYVKSFIAERPEPGVLIFKNAGTEFFTDPDLPPRSREYQMKIRDQEFSRSLKDQKRLDKEAERKMKKKKRPRSTSTVSADESDKSNGSKKSTRKNIIRIPKKKIKKEVSDDDLPQFEMSKEELGQLAPVSLDAPL